MNRLKWPLAIVIVWTSVWCLSARDYVVQTPRTSLVLNVEEGKKPLWVYYGSRVEASQTEQLRSAGLALERESYPAFGLIESMDKLGEKAMAVTHADGNMSLDLAVTRVIQSADSEGELTVIEMKDRLYPFVVKQCFKAYRGTDIISTWVEAVNTGKKPVVLRKFASAMMPVVRGDNWLTHFHGFWGAEATMDEERLTQGTKAIRSNDALVNTESDNPSVMLTLDGKPSENAGRVIGATLAWTGAYDIKVDVHKTFLNLIAGIKEEHSSWTLEGGQKFVTPELCLTYSCEGKGGVSRAFHRWARRYKITGGDRLHDILLNSWEGVYFKVNQKEMDDMMAAFADLGGELFVMDDGWFGNKYPRNAGNSSLGDWEVCREKLPEGIGGLVRSAKSHGIKFGIWIEPEMANTKSDLFEKHPDWVLCVKDRPLSKGRGGTQIVLDLCNPKVQDFVFSVVDRLMTENPEIAYMKWDCNAYLMDYGSQYLPANRQSHIAIEYQRGLENVLRRIRAKYPDLVMQACAGGGGRVTYGMLPWFNEFWPSDDTDALQRIYLQWGISHFYPAVAMASHVSANKNHQTGRTVPLKYRFDVAMGGRLGMEIQPKDMSDADKAFARRAIAAYKQIRPVVQQGDLYRLVSPYDREGVASLMYVSEAKDEAVFYVYKTEHFINMTVPGVRLRGLDAERLYRLTDLTPADVKKPCPLDGKTVSGRLLMEEGLPMAGVLKSEYASLALRLEAVD